MMAGEFLQQFVRVIGIGWQDVLTPPGWPLWKNDVSYHNLSVEDATELALDRPLWRLAASGATHWNGAGWTMMMAMMMTINNDKACTRKNTLPRSESRGLLGSPVSHNYSIISTLVLAFMWHLRC